MRLTSLRSIESDEYTRIMDNIGDSSLNATGLESAWSQKNYRLGELNLIGYSPLPPPSIGNACILQGSLNKEIEKTEPVASVSFLLQGSPIVTCNTGVEILRRKLRSGTVGITPARATWKFKTEGVHTSLNLAIEDASIQAFAAQEFDHSGSRVELEGTLQTSRPPELFALGLAFSRLIQYPKRGSALYSQALWTQILLQLLWYHSSLSAEDQSSEVLNLSSDCISMATSFMHDTLNQDISLSAIADQVGLSPGYFLRAFKKSTGKTPMQFRAELRIEKACELLRSTSIDLASISSILGFASPSQFSTVFKRRMGCAPSVFRREMR